MNIGSAKARAGNLLLAAALGTAAVPAAAVTIDFGSGVATVGATLTTYVEDGFTFTSATNAPLTEAWSFAGTASTQASFTDKAFSVAAAGASFTLESLRIAETTFDFGLGCAVGPGFGSAVSLQGWLGGASVFSATTAAQCPEGAFSLRSFALPAFDRLDVSIGGLAAVALDDMVLSPVPEPASAGLLALGLLGVALMRRRAAARA